MSFVLPPYAEFLGITMEEGDGAPTLILPFGNIVLGRPGFLHGGAISGLVEMAAVAAMRHALDGDGRGDAHLKPVNVSVDFMRGGREKLTYAQGRVIRLGKRVSNVEAFAWQDDRDRPIVSARMTFLIKDA